MYGAPYMVSVSPDRVAVVARGFSRSALREQAVRECERVLGRQDDWQLTQAEIVPCMVSLGGRVRLYEGRFVATHS
jgi:hypothetical protein